MKKLVLVLTLLSLLISCDFSLIKETGERFKETVLSDKGSEKIKFLIIADLHLGREKEDNGVTDYSETILSYISEEDGYEFALLSGDVADTAHQFSRAKDFITKLKDKMGNDNVIYALGNHELHYANKKAWLDHDFGDKEHNLFHKYVFDGVSIYKLDTSDRALGFAQFSALEEALKADDNKFKLMLSHVPISGKNTQMTSLQFTLASADERNKLILLMNKYNVGTYITGHHHIGNYAEHFTPTNSEFMLAAAHARDLFGLESSGYYYEGLLDKAKKELIIKAFNAKDDSLAKTYTFKQP